MKVQVFSLARPDGLNRRSSTAGGGVRNLCLAKRRERSEPGVSITRRSPFSPTKRKTTRNTLVIFYTNEAKVANVSL